MKLRPEAKESLLKEVQKYPARKYLKCPRIKSLRIAMILATAGNPHRFRTKRQYWAYTGLAVETKSSDDYEMIHGIIRRKKKMPLTRGLNRNYSRRLDLTSSDIVWQTSKMKSLQTYSQLLRTSDSDFAICQASARFVVQYREFRVHFLPSTII